MSTAADIGNGLCKGLILINSAGQVLSPADYNTKLQTTNKGRTVEHLTRNKLLPPLSVPPKFLASGISKLLFFYLQPNIEKICKDLYRSKPEEVTPELTKNILRDSNDPGALNVFASGARLPTPRTANELISKFKGNVLVTQGILDPLNDASGRAKLFREIGKETQQVDVEEIEMGHCGHDERPYEVARSIKTFVQEINGGEPLGHMKSESEPRSLQASS